MLFPQRKQRNEMNREGERTKSKNNGSDWEESERHLKEEQNGSDLEYVQSEPAMLSYQNAPKCVLKQAFGEPNGPKHEQRSRKVTQTAQFHRMVVLVTLVHRIGPLPSK
jgi:hypothetical protein